MKKLLRLAFMAASLAAVVSCQRKPLADIPLERNLGGVDTAEFHNVFNAVYGTPCNELHSLMVLKDGKVVYERYALGHTPDELHIMWSASKTFTATAVGFAVQDSLLSVDDKVVSFFPPEELPDTLSVWLKELSVKDLLTMSSGFDRDLVSRACSMEDFDWAKEILSCRIVWEPGTLFSYNSMNSYLLSVIVSKVTGLKLADYLNEKLFKPLGIRRFEWMESPQGFNCGGWGLHITTESVAKMCQFFLNKGVWQGKRILDPKWIEAAEAPQRYDNLLQDEESLRLNAGNEWAQGYGYQMWIGTHNHVRLDGASGQFGIILPDKNAAVILTSHTNDTKAELEAVWRFIYPSL